MNILSPLLIYPRSYSLSYLSAINESNSKQSNIFTQNFILPYRKRKLCLQVQIHSLEDNQNLDRVLSTDHRLNEEEDSHSIDTTHAVISDSTHSSNDSFELPSNPTNISVPVHLSTLGIRNDFPQLILQRHIPSESLFQTNIPSIESRQLVSAPDNHRFIVQKFKRMRNAASE